MTCPEGAYYQHARPEVCDLLGGRGLRVLELGCASGRLGEELKRRGTASTVDGVELHAPAAVEARARLDAVWQADVDRVALATVVDGPYDAVVASDVLEHLVDPWRVVGELYELLRPDGVVVGSLPNIRHHGVVGPLLLGGRFPYAEEGVLDRTHLRFFTRRSVAELFEGAGFTVERIERRVPQGIPRWKRAVLRSLGDLGARQLLVRARRP